MASIVSYLIRINSKFMGMAYIQCNQKILKAADVISERETSYGLEYLQFDDGYRQLPNGLPQNWLSANPKFPSGKKSLADYITSKGLTPG